YVFITTPLCDRSSLLPYTTLFRSYRDFAHDKHRTVDDTPFGGGAGMVIKPEPVVEALEAVEARRGPMHRILLTPSAPRFDQRVADRKSTRLNSSHVKISYAVFCLK